MNPETRHYLSELRSKCRTAEYKADELAKMARMGMLGGDVFELPRWEGRAEAFGHMADWLSRWLVVTDESR